MSEAAGRKVSSWRGAAGRACSGPPPSAWYLYGIQQNSSFSSFLVVQLHDAGGRRGELELQSQGGEPLESSILHSTRPFLDLELHWQDLLAVMEPPVRFKLNYSRLEQNADSDGSSFWWHAELKGH